MLFYIYRLNPARNEGSRSLMPPSASDLEHISQEKCHQREVKRIYQGARENHLLERRLFL
jgi:hypothetical protein